MMKTLFIKILRFLMLLVFIASCGIGYVIYEDTLTAWWIPVGIALLIALATIPFYKKWIRSEERRVGKECRYRW